MSNTIRDELVAHIALAFKHLYPHVSPRVEIDDEVLYVHIDDEADNYPSFRCLPPSDNDEYLLFTVYDEEDEPADDDFEYIAVRIRIPSLTAED